MTTEQVINHPVFKKFGYNPEWICIHPNTYKYLMVKK